MLDKGVDMSIVREYYPQCDKCGWTNPDLRTQSLNEAKRCARQDGWLVKSNGETICEECQIIEELPNK